MGKLGVRGGGGGDKSFGLRRLVLEADVDGGALSLALLVAESDDLRFRRELLSFSSDKDFFERSNAFRQINFLFASRNKFSN